MLKETGEVHSFFSPSPLLLLAQSTPPEKRLIGSIPLQLSEFTYLRSQFIILNRAITVLQLFKTHHHLPFRYVSQNLWIKIPPTLFFFSSPLSFLSLQLATAHAPLLCHRRNPSSPPLLSPNPLLPSSTAADSSPPPLPSPIAGDSSTPLPSLPRRHLPPFHGAARRASGAAQPCGRGAGIAGAAIWARSRHGPRGGMEVRASQARQRAGRSGGPRARGAEAWPHKRGSRAARRCGCGAGTATNWRRRRRPRQA
jgi:hypothetical protein